MIYLDVGAILLIFVSVPLVITAVLALVYNFRSIHRPMRERARVSTHVPTAATYMPSPAIVRWTVARAAGI